MAIYRGAGGAGDAVNDSSSEARITIEARDAALAAQAAAEVAQTGAEVAQAATEAIYDSFDDRYLGAYTSDPIVDNDGNPLLVGALYFDSTNNIMKMWNGFYWLVTYTTISGGLIAANNLADVVSKPTAIANLGIGGSGTAGGLVPTGGTANQILSKNSSTNYDTAWIDNYATQVKFSAKNTTGSTLNKGTIVYISGAAGANPYMSPAQANTDATSATTIGFLESTVANNGSGLIVVEGTLVGVNTSAATEGDPVWLSPTTAGGMVFGMANKPSAPNHLVYMGTVTRVHATVGEILVRVANGYELEELHNVAISSPSDWQAIVYESSTQLYKNKTMTTAHVTEQTNLYYTDARVRSALSFTAGSGAYDNSTGVITIPTNTSHLTNGAGFLTPSAVTAGTGLSQTNGTGIITINATGSTINSQTTAYTLVASDAGKSISITTGGVTIPASVLAAGNIVTIYNNSGSSQTITQGSGLTLQWAGQASSTTGNRTLGLYGIATLIFISPTVAVISGAGLT